MKIFFVAFIEISKTNFLDSTSRLDILPEAYGSSVGHINRWQGFLGVVNPTQIRDFSTLSSARSRAYLHTYIIGNYNYITQDYDLAHDNTYVYKWLQCKVNFEQ